MRRPAFSLGTGGCTCSSCSYTAEHDKGWAAWPRGNPAGRRSAAAYAAHVAHGKDASPGWSDGKALPDQYRVIRPEPIYPHIPGLVPPIAQNLVAVRWNQRAAQELAKRKTARSPQPFPRPEPAGKPAAALSHADRGERTATILPMPKPKPRGRGRPPIKPGESVVRRLVSLDAATVKALRKAGDGNLSAGIRKLAAKG